MLSINIRKEIFYEKKVKNYFAIICLKNIILFCLVFQKNAEEDMDRSAGKNVNDSINVPMEEHLDLLFKEDNIGMEHRIVNENFPKLDIYDRTAFYNAMERWNTWELEKIKFVGKYWMILADFYTVLLDCH